MAENNYITPRYDAQAVFAAYMQENEALKKKRKWGNIWNNAASLFDPNHRASGMFDQNKKRINSMSTSGMGSAVKQMKLMNAAEKEQINRELNARLLLSMPQLKSMSDFNAWFMDQGPGVADYYKDLMGTWANTAQEKRAAQDQNIQLQPHVVKRLAQKYLPNYRDGYHQAVSEGTVDQYMRTMYENLEADDSIPAGLLMPLKEEMSRILGVRMKHLGSATELYRKDIEWKEGRSELERKKAATPVLNRYASRITQQWKEIPVGERTAQALSDLIISQEISNEDLVNEFVTYKKLSEIVTARVGTPAEARAKINQGFTVADRLREDALRDAGVVMSSGDMREAQTVVNLILAENTPEARLAKYQELTPALYERLTKTVYGDSPTITTQRLAAVQKVLDSNLGTLAGMRKEITDTTEAERSRIKWVETLRTNLEAQQKSLKEMKWSVVVNEIPKPANYEEYAKTRDTLEDTLEKMGKFTGKEIAEAMTNFDNRQTADVKKLPVTKGILDNIREISRDIKPRSVGLSALPEDLDELSDTIDAVWEVVDGQVVGKDYDLMRIGRFALPRREKVNRQMWTALRLSHKRSDWKRITNLIESYAEKLEKKLDNNNQPLPDIPMGKRPEMIRTLLRRVGYVIPAELIAYQNFYDLWKTQYIR
jgi:hypothetical protein